MSAASPKPKIIYLCGAHLFLQRATTIAEREEIEGNVVLHPGVNVGDAEHVKDMLGSEDGYPAVRAQLMALAFQKINLADEVLVLNVGGTVSGPMLVEIAYAIGLGRRVRFVDNERIPDAAVRLVRGTRAFRFSGSFVPTIVR